MEVRHSSKLGRFGPGDGLYNMKESCVTSPAVSAVAHITVPVLATPLQLIF